MLELVDELLKHLLLEFLIEEDGTEDEDHRVGYSSESVRFLVFLLYFSVLNNWNLILAIGVD
jgi:hypothetical protein